MHTERSSITKVASVKTRHKYHPGVFLDLGVGVQRGEGVAVRHVGFGQEPGRRLLHVLVVGAPTVHLRAEKNE